MPKTNQQSKEVTERPFQEIDASETAFGENYNKHYQLFEKYRESKEANIRFFTKNGKQRNINDYIQDSVDRMNEFLDKPNWKEDWQNNTFDPITRNKLIALLSVLASQRMKPEVLAMPANIFAAVDTEERAMLYEDLLEAANIKNQEDEKIIWEIYSCMEQGTIVGFESWKKDRREADFVTDFDPDTGEKKTHHVQYDAWDDVYGELLPIQEFYPETIWVNPSEFKQKVRRAFWAREMTMDAFKDNFGKWANADKVKTAGDWATPDTGAYHYGISSDVQQDHVQVLQFFDTVADKMGIWANGEELYYGPMPWNHKQLPFWIAIFEPINKEFLFGKSLPDKLMGQQDPANAILNNMLDQLFIALNSPIFADGDVDDLDEGYLEPKRIYTMAPGTKIQKAALGNIDPMAMPVYQLLKRSMEETSVSAQFQGVPSGGRKTKFEVQQLQEGALNLAGLSLQLMEYAEAQKYLLRMYNIIDYYTMPSQKKSGKMKYKFIEMKDRKLTNGKTGRKLIQIVGNASDIPSQEEVIQQTQKLEGKKFDPLESRVEPIFVTKAYLLNRELELAIRMIPNSSVKESQAQRDNKFLAFYDRTVEHPLVDQEINVKKLAKAMGVDEEVVKKAQAQDPLQQMMAQKGGGGQAPNTPLI